MANEADRMMRQGMSATRWVLAPMYLGLALMLVVLMILFIRDFFQFLPQMFQMRGDEAVGVLINLAGIVLWSNLILVVVQTGYDLFGPGSGLNHDPEDGSGRVNFVRLRWKILAAAIVLSIVYLLQALAEISTGAESPATSELQILAAVFFALVLSTFVLAVAEWFFGLTSRQITKNERHTQGNAG